MTTHPVDLLVPRPQHSEVREGFLSLAEPTIATVADDDEIALLNHCLGAACGVVFHRADSGPVRVDVDPSLPAEGYRLDVTQDSLTISASDMEGLRHAAQTVVGLLPVEAWMPGTMAGPVEIPCCRVEDEPALAWRGMHVDVARHFQPLRWLFDFIDELAWHKFNILHLHLTDDQGWRFEVKALPELTRTGSWRESTSVLADLDTQDGTPHGGFYTQDQLRALVRYAHGRGITIVPEIDVPGHVRSLLAAYPQFGDGQKRPVATTFGIFDEVLELTDATLHAVEQIFTELLDVFDSPWIHIGGDECPTVQWRDNPAADALAHAHGLEHGEQIQRWFTEHLRDWLESHGRIAVAWDEVIEHGEVPGAVVMSWRGVEPGQRAMAQGHPVVMSRSDMLYFDHYQSDDPNEPHAIGGHTPWQKVAELDPWEGVGEANRANLLGIQGQLWSEYIPDPRQMEYMAFPRASVLAEVAWRGSVDDPTFADRLACHVERLRAAGVNARPLDGPLPWQQGGSGARRRNN
ncbi:beta-N-acetylhexosaminidase [Cutibacterium equinum]|uniref:beta-N-acetylhexosaminidase n=1 Tax=Cutibacterium equinum TaxID=3016342 RepID=A0ABY7QWY9_9ACTN|nr:beta-N-acetylhexosaminidase [Cutibacterium equinum]WCC79230.1 beta-N-acetylhexosaminidase [Cutibacterium equinum]